MDSFVSITKQQKATRDEARFGMVRDGMDNSSGAAEQLAGGHPSIGGSCLASQG